MLTLKKKAYTARHVGTNAQKKWVLDFYEANKERYENKTQAAEDLTEKLGTTEEIPKKGDRAKFRTVYRWVIES
jgi:RPA family protein